MEGKKGKNGNLDHIYYEGVKGRVGRKNPLIAASGDLVSRRRFQEQDRAEQRLGGWHNVTLKSLIRTLRRTRIATGRPRQTLVKERNQREKRLSRKKM